MVVEDKKPTTVEVLKRAKELLEKGWCKGEFAKAQDGTRADSLGPDACSWCMAGAVARAKDELGADYAEHIHIINIVAGAMDNEYWSVAQFNDDERTSFEDVVRVMDAAIVKAAEKSE